MNTFFKRKKAKNSTQATPVPEDIKNLRDNLETGFLGFWIKQYRISYLVVIALIVLGIVSMLNIQKESSPNIKFGIISISTVYPGASPVDVDSLVTDKIYKEIKDLEGSKKITSASSLGVSSVTIELQPETDVTNFMNDVRNSISRISLPKDAKTPNVIEIKSQSNFVKGITLYSPTGKVSLEKLRLLGADIKDELSLLPSIQKVEYGSVLNYDVQVVFDKETLKGLGITVADVANTVRSFNQDVPIGNFGVGNKNFDFRVSGKLSEQNDILRIPLTLPGGKTITIGEIATIERKYDDITKNRIGLPNTQAFESVSMTVSKNESTSIFAASAAIQKVIDEKKSTPEFEGVDFAFSNDQADLIRDDYEELGHEALVTLGLVFFVMLLFIGFKDSIFATVTLPLAFLVTFIFLEKLGFSLNFLTNFSLVLSFGIAIDTIIVIVQAASAKVRVGYNPRTAIMLALREYGIPVISGVMTTIVAFVPMMVLPDILGKFLAYIPITIFGVLASGLVLALTVNSALYLLFVKPRKSYVEDENAIEYATDEEKKLLAFERIGKERIEESTAPLRIRVIHTATAAYKRTLRKFLESKLLRKLSIFVPVILLVLSFVPVFGGKSLAGHVGFDLFPASDNGYVEYEVKGTPGQRLQAFDSLVPEIATIISRYPEVRFYEVITKDTKNSTQAGISVQVTLKKIQERKEQNMRSVFEIDKLLLQDFELIRSKGYEVASKVREGGPPASKAIALKINADSTEKLDELIAVAQIFEKELRSYEGVKNIENSSGEAPGQFIYTFDKRVISELGIPVGVLTEQITSLLNGVTVGTIAENGEDLDIVVKYRESIGDVKPEFIDGHVFVYAGKKYRLGDFLKQNLTNSIASVKRESGLVTISVGADALDGFLASDIQSRFVKFAQDYTFPPGISFSAGGENQENAALISAILSAFFIAMLAIFAILTLQFNSFKQPVIVLYSVIMAIPFVFVGLLLTGNQLSMPFGIGFIAFTGIAVNHGIILIDAININLRKGMTGITALVEAGSSRLEPMILTTLTTSLGILPLALRDAFWAGLGFTIIFGLIACTFLTLFVVKGIYYEVIMGKKNEDIAGGNNTSGHANEKIGSDSTNESTSNSINGSMNESRSESVAA